MRRSWALRLRAALSFPSLIYCVIISVCFCVFFFSFIFFYLHFLSISFHFFLYCLSAYLYFCFSVSLFSFLSSPSFPFFPVHFFPSCCSFAFLSISLSVYLCLLFSLPSNLSTFPPSISFLHVSLFLSISFLSSPLSHFHFLSPFISLLLAVPSTLSFTFLHFSIYLSPPLPPPRSSSIHLSPSLCSSSYLSLSFPPSLPLPLSSPIYLSPCRSSIFFLYLSLSISFFPSSSTSTFFLHSSLLPLVPPPLHASLGPRRWRAGGRVWNG